VGPARRAARPGRRVAGPLRPGQGREPGDPAPRRGDAAPGAGAVPGSTRRATSAPAASIATTLQVVEPTSTPIATALIRSSP
jgi:hypothetical protein